MKPSPKKNRFALDNRQLMIAAGAVFGLVLIIALIMQFGPSSANGDKTPAAKDQQATEQPPNPSVTDPGNQQTKPTAATTITITADGFSPASITVARGTTLTWTNADSSNHAIDAIGDGESLHSPQLAPKASFNYSFQKTGTFTYNDPIHPDHKGSVTITEVDNHR